MIPNFLRNDNAHGQGLIQRDARFLDLKDEVAADLIDHGNGLPHDKAKLGQMLADLIFAGDLSDGNGIACFSHR